MLIELKALEKRYTSDTVVTTALNGIDLKITDGEFVAIMGQSGCGKSTLLNILGLIDYPSNGKYILHGSHTETLSQTDRAKLRKMNIGFVFQDFNLIEDITVQANIELALRYHKNIKKADRKARCEDVMNRLGIYHRKDHRPSQLSGGQQQRVAIARAILPDPALILADEPTGNLDSENTADVLELLTQLHQDLTTIVMVTHAMEDANIAQRIVTLSDGEVISDLQK